MLKCPNCENKVLQATPTPNKVMLAMCPNCRGSWMKVEDLAQLTGNPGEFERQFERAKVNGKSSDKSSPISGKPMLEVPFRGKHPVYFCGDSSGIWVEKEEMRAVIR